MTRLLGRLGQPDREEAATFLAGLCVIPKTANTRRKHLGNSPAFTQLLPRRQIGPPWLQELKCTPPH